MGVPAGMEGSVMSMGRVVAHTALPAAAALTLGEGPVGGSAAQPMGVAATAGPPAVARATGVAAAAGGGARGGGGGAPAVGENRPEGPGAGGWGGGGGGGARGVGEHRPGGAGGGGGGGDGQGGGGGAGDVGVAAPPVGGDLPLHPWCGHTGGRRGEGGRVTVEDGLVAGVGGDGGGGQGQGCGLHEPVEDVLGGALDAAVDRSGFGG